MLAFGRSADLPLFHGASYYHIGKLNHEASVAYILDPQPIHQLIHKVIRTPIHDPLHCLVQGGEPRLYEKSSAERGAHPPLMNRTTHYQMTKLRNMSAANLICCSRSSLLL